MVWFGIQNLPLNLILNTSKHDVKNHWISSKSFLVQNGVQIKQLYWNYITRWLDQNFVGFRVTGILQETNMLIVLQKMLYQKHNLHILNCHVQMFFMKIQPFVSSLWQEHWDKEVGNKLHAIMPQIDEKYYSGCTNRKDKVIIPFE